MKVEQFICHVHADNLNEDENTRDSHMAITESHLDPWSARANALPTELAEYGTWYQLPSAFRANGLHTELHVALFPGAQIKSERSAWDPLSVHVWLPRLFWGTWNYRDTSPCCKTVHYWITGVVTSWCISVRSTKLYRVPSVRLQSQEWHWRTNNWCQYRTFMARTCLYCYQQARKYICCLYLCLTSTLESQKWHITIMDLWATVLHSVATHWNSRSLKFENKGNN